MRVLAVLALFTASLFPVFVISDAVQRVGQEEVLEPARSPEAEYGAEHPSEALHIPGAIAMALIAISGLVGLIVRPESAAAGTHSLAVAAAMVLAAGIAGDPDNHGGQGLPIDPAIVVLALPVLAAAAISAPWRTWRGGLKHPLLLLFAVLATPMLWYGFDQALLQRNTWPPLADPHHQGHWMVTAQLALAIPLLTAGAAISGRGWQMAAITGGAAAMVVGAASIVVPDAGSALVMPWAIAAASWGGALLVATWMESRRVEPALPAG